MKINTAGGETHFWNAQGRSTPIDNMISLSPDEADAVNRVIAEMLGLKVRNPSLSEISAERLKSLIEKHHLDLKARWDLLKKAMKHAGKKLPEKNQNWAISFDGESGLAKVMINSGNKKTGPCLSTSASQASCPDGHNNRSGFLCPLYGSGCYAEEGRQYLSVTRHLNDAAGVNPKKKKRSSISPEAVAREEAETMRRASMIWILTRLNNAVRGHVVGDCVTPEAARIWSREAEIFVEDKLSGIGVTADRFTKNVWTYTHGWRDVPRSAWSPNISVLASCDTVDDLEKAHAKGYGTCIVVPDYVVIEANGRLQYDRKAMKLENGWTLLPCPHEVNDKNNRGELTWCLECGFCMKDDSMLRKNKVAVAFAAHTGKAEEVSKQLVNIENLGVRK